MADALRYRNDKPLIYWLQRKRRHRHSSEVTQSFERFTEDGTTMRLTEDGIPRIAEEG